LAIKRPDAMMKYGKLRSGGMLLALLVVALLTLGFATQHYVSVPQGQIVINLSPQGNYFVLEEDVRAVLMREAQGLTDSTSANPVDLRLLEESLLGYSFVKEAQASRDIKGNLVVDVWQDEPVARLIGNSGKGAYITRERHLMPLSSKFSPRVIVISGAGADSLLSETFLRSRKGRQICDLVDHINRDAFLSKQLAQMDINRWMAITLYPQVGKQAIEFGKAADFEEKFRKLDIFYREIVPKRGWNAYSMVKLQYEGQIVCKK
jgi:cell division protein FtsQ